MASAVDDDEPGDSRLSALVKMAREDFDEEPAPRIDALLMAAARKHAPQPKVGMFERLRRWLAASMMNPAIAGATALVVIGGTAGVLYMKNQGRIAQPTVARPGEPARLQAPETQPGGELAQQLDRLDDTEAAPALQAPVTPPPPDPEPPPDTKPKPRGGDRRAETPAPPPGDGTGEGGGVAIATGGVQTDMGGGDTFNAVAEDERRLEERPPPPPDDEVVAGIAQTETAVTVRDAATAPSNRSQVENLHRQAKNAARQRQCAPVKVMAQRAKKLDEEYYSRNIAIDPEIKPCL